MKKIFMFIALTAISAVSFAQTIVINEVDADTPSTDLAEFIELKTSTPNMSLDGYVVVLFNGNGDVSYEAYDLDGYTSDVNGLFVIGTNEVSPTPDYIFPKASDNVQNGADAVAVYQASASDFPIGTAVTTTNLIDAFVYDTSDGDDSGLLTGLNQSVQYDENGSGDKDNHSNQRKTDGTFEQKTPTPKALNDGSGVNQISITISTAQSTYGEGESFDLTFTSSENLTSDLTVNFTLINGDFTSNDYSGNLSATITSGSNSGKSTISIVDDSENEGNETLLVKFVNLDGNYIAFNDGYTVNISDNDFVQSSYGTPVNPTYDKINSTAPSDYWASLDGKSGQDLKDAITAIIADPTVVRAQTYGDVWDILKEADQNPENDQEVWLVYTEQGRPKIDQQGSTLSPDAWNREHVYPQSRGGFSDGTSFTADGIDVYMNTDATHTEHGHSDAHSLRAADPSENSSRSNSDYGDDYSGPSGTAGSWKGDVARSVMYMALRFNDLDVVSGNPDDSTVGELGDLNYLLQWHSQDKPDDFEMNRNNVVYKWQKNRNPFIDMPELVEYVYGTKVGQVWNSSLAIDKVERNINSYPNPVVDRLNFETSLNGEIEVYSVDGSKVLQNNLNGNSIGLSALKSGVYYYLIKTENENFKGRFIKR